MLDKLQDIILDYLVTNCEKSNSVETCFNAAFKR